MGEIGVAIISGQMMKCDLIVLGVFVSKFVCFYITIINGTEARFKRG